MLSRIRSAALFGIEAHIVEVEVEVSLGIPKLVLVGLADTAVRESGERVRAAIKNSGYSFPPRRITINLAPGSRKKEGPFFDLPIAMGILLASEQLTHTKTENCLMAGELALDGSLRPIRGALSIAIMAKEKGCRKLFLPASNAAEAATVEGISVFPLRKLADLVGYLRGEKALSTCQPLPVCFHETKANPQLDFSDVYGLEGVKRALLVAVAGGHHILMIGPPGSGKTMLARRVPSILPRMSREEAISTSRVYSLISGPSKRLVCIRPFRSPHHSITPAGFVGGGAAIRPGELSLSHNGVLFMDEFPEFNQRLLEMLRQPIEEGKVVLSRAKGSVTYPCCIMLVAAMNPCPCGYYGSSNAVCQCTPTQIRKYRNRISGPILDRIDLHVEVPRMPLKEIHRSAGGIPSAKIREKVFQAREIQKKRYRGTGVTVNALLTSSSIKRYCRLKAEAEDFLKTALTRLQFSARAYHKILKIARTISDIEGKGEIKKEHLLEAMQYRVMDREETRLS